jgi:hypothetical protein
MGVKRILALAGAKIGLNPNAQSSRTVLLRFLNEGAKELYDQSDLPGSLREATFKVNGDQTIACPWYVGELRGAREYDSQIVWSFNQMRPRYNQFNWPDSWRNLRLKNIQPLMASVTNQSVGVLTVPAIENPPITVTVAGPTAVSSLTTEDVVMSSTKILTGNQYLDYVVVKKDRVNLYDVFLEDVDGNVLTIISNNMIEAKYQIIDVSTCPWLAVSTSALDHYIEVLFKHTLPYLSLDSDEFPAGSDYDFAIINKMLQLYYEEQGKTDLAVAYDAKATRTVARIRENQNRATEDVVGFVANPHDVLLPRVRQGRRKYYRGYGSRGYGY